MTAQANWRGFGVVALAATVLALLPVGCSPTMGSGQQNRPETPEVVATPTDAWFSALQKTPYPYLLPLPKPLRTVLDGTYTKVEFKDTPQVHCLRCPDYTTEGGIWKLNLDQGTFRILHGTTGWQSVGSFITTRDRAIYLRATNLTSLPWLSCQPPNTEAGTTDHWLKPAGCD
jgi:hypothetical protein